MAVQEIETEYKKRLQPTPYWSIADEPSNPGNKDLFLDMHKSFSMLAPEAKLAGHLNSREDRAYLSMFDLVLINDGFGIDVEDVQETQKDEREVWLYNLPHPRAAAGFYLWRSGADGFLKWHGRMPTADPFDPTDGREFDVQLLYPSAQPARMPRTSMQISMRSPRALLITAGFNGWKQRPKPTQTQSRCYCR